MLKRVAVSDVEMGMFIHKMEGSWFKHPFWKGRFLLDDPEKLDDLKLSDVETVAIDTAKGRMPACDDAVAPVGASTAAATALSAAPRKVPRVAALRTRTSVDFSSTKPTSTALEIGTARLVADRAQQTVSRLFVDARLGKAIDTRIVEPVVADIYASVQRNPHAFSSLMRCKLNNEFVYRHAVSVSALMVSLARKMGLPAEKTREAGLAGLFLDIGTNYLPKDLAPANGDYRNAEPEIWRQHVFFGHKALEEAGGIPETVLHACLQHHEHMDGTGYPHGIEGEKIAPLARMAAICDTFDFLLTDCETAKGLDPAAAIAKLKEMNGVFDAAILRNFIESVGVYPVGSFVTLRSNRLAMVIDEDREDPSLPVVLAFYSLVSERRVRPEKIELARCFGKDEIVGIAHLSGLVLPEEAQLRDLLFLSAHKFKR